MVTRPRIGIRPIIDGRIRAEQEPKVLALCASVKRLIEENLRCLDGTAAECLTSDCCISGSPEAESCARQFAAGGVVGTLSITSCWCYGSETMDMDPATVKAVWGFNGTEYSGAVYLAAVMAAHAQKGYPAFSIYGQTVQDAADNELPPDVAESILRFARCALAVGQMRGKSYVNIGAVSMGIMGSYCDDRFFRDYLNMRTEYVDMTEILRRMKRGLYDEAEYGKALAWTKQNCPEGVDRNPAALRHTEQEKRAEWQLVVQQALIARDIMVGNPKLADMGFMEESLGRNAIAGGFQGQRMWSDWMPVGDFAESISNSTFDWNGARPPLVLATENDTLNAVAMLFATLLTNGASIFADVRCCWTPASVEAKTGWRPAGDAANGFLHLINSGAAALDGCGKVEDADGHAVMKPWYDMTERDTEACLKACRWHPANASFFRGGGFSVRYRTEARMPVTMLRVNIAAGVGPVLQIAEGYTIRLPEDVADTIDARTDPTWPTTWFAPILTGEGAFKSTYSVMYHWGANHAALAYGHIGDRLVTLASMLRIPVSMHNVSEERIFRPHSWSAFGTADLENADYRACAAYGPLYGGTRL